MSSLAYRSRSPTASPLASCPEDILHLIFETMSPADLYTVSLVNKNLRIVAEPLLYSHIHWTWLESRTPPITLLLRTILRRPKLATYVRNVIFDGGTFYDPPFRGTVPKIPISGLELDESIAFIERTKVSYGELWIRELRGGTMDAYLALLLSQLSHLTSLHLGPNFTKESRLVGMMFRSALCEPVDCGLPNFQHLRDVSFNLKIDYYRGRRVKTWVKNTADVLPFFYLPTVERIAASIDNPVTFVWPAVRAPVPARLTSLDLTFMREAQLDQLLSVTSGLTTLHWDWYHNPDFWENDRFNTPIIDLVQIVAAISHVRGSLKDLTISAGLDYGNGNLEYPPLKIQGSLNPIVDFEALKRFEAPLPFLLGFSPDTTKRLDRVIPRNIEFLTITDDLRLQEENGWDDHALLSVIQSWLENWKVSTPHLRGLSLLLRQTDDEWNLPMRNELRELCAGAGIRLEITKLSSDMY